jgi:hypothetical protein
MPHHMQTFLEVIVMVTIDVGLFWLNETAKVQRKSALAYTIGSTDSVPVAIRNGKQR